MLALAYDSVNGITLLIRVQHYCSHLMHSRQHSNEVYLKWCQEDEWHSKSLTKMSQGFHDGNEEDRLNLEYFRYAIVTHESVQTNNNILGCCLFRCQLDLFSCMCYGRQYLAIPPIKDQLPISLVLRCMKNTNLPFTLRASFCHIMLCVHLDTIPNELITPVELARLWNEIPEKLSLSKCSSLDKLVHLCTLLYFPSNIICSITIMSDLSLRQNI